MNVVLTSLHRAYAANRAELLERGVTVPKNPKDFDTQCISYGNHDDNTCYLLKLAFGLARIIRDYEVEHEKFLRSKNGGAKRTKSAEANREVVCELINELMTDESNLELKQGQVIKWLLAHPRINGVAGFSEPTVTRHYRDLKNKARKIQKEYGWKTSTSLEEKKNFLKHRTPGIFTFNTMQHF